MPRILEIKKYPTLFDDAKNGSSHESLLRAFHILEYVKELLKIKTPPEVILEIIDTIEEKETNQ